MKFEEMNLSARMIDALRNMNYLTPTEVQEKTIPLIFLGKEVVVRSKTGSGKTAAFGIGMIELISKEKNKKGLVVVPTRELAVQITTELRALSQNSKMGIYAIYGGQDMARQISMIQRGFGIVIATPGRLLDHIRRGTIRLENVDLIVLDEADIMLDMGFKEDIDSILKETNEKRKIMLFSATIDSRVKKLSRDYMDNPEIIEIGSEEVAEIEEKTIILKRREKIGKLVEIIKQNPRTKIIIFAATKNSVEFIYRVLNENRINAQYLHGGKTQNQREKTLDGFKKGHFEILVATDVASRGLHIEDVGIIINFDRAGSQDTYLHRIGRTGRMGKKGIAIKFHEEDPYVPGEKRSRPVDLRKYDRPRKRFFSGRNRHL
ncbi:MAG: DEAD/DEAH box helicase [Candidatus Micrarchaeia archaeon]